MKVSINTQTWIGDNVVEPEREIDVTVNANVTIEKDGYGTGDSPTLYEVELLSVVDEDDDNVLNKLSASDKLFLEDAVIKQLCNSIDLY